VQGFGRGIAAPQVGESLRVIVPDLGAGPFALLNPEIGWRSEETWSRCERHESVAARGSAVGAPLAARSAATGRNKAAVVAVIGWARRSGRSYGAVAGVSAALLRARFGIHDEVLIAPRAALLECGAWAAAAGLR
jgi:hypothetical protein